VRRQSRTGNCKKIENMTHVTPVGDAVLVFTEIAAVRRLKKVKAVYSASRETHSYGASLAIWDHSVTCHPTQVNAPRLNPSQTGRYSIYLTRRDGRLS